MMNIKSRSRGPRKSVVILAGLSLACLIASASPHVFGGLSNRYLGTRAQKVTKEQMTEELSQLDAQISSLKQQLVGDPKNLILKAQLEQALAAYDSLSAQLGGDRAPSQAQVVQELESSGLGAPAVVAAVPTGCTPTTATFSNNTPVAIPDNNPAGITSTVDVSGAGPYLWDANVTLNITHTFPGDLDITLTSPSGTVVTLTTDNAGTSDNAFAGTTFDDQADPNSQIPYAVNPNMVTDHTYTTNVVASPLTPEEPLSAFNGEDPNGTWTLKVVDDAGLDTGTLNSWSLEITTLDTAPTNDTSANFANMTPVAIPDNDPTGITSTINVSGFATSLCDVNVTLNITHTFPGDLDITLTSPSGTVVTLTTDNAGTNDDVFAGTTFDDQADPNSQIPYAVNPNLVTDHAYSIGVVVTTLTPEEPLSAFNGEDPNGAWTLKVIDDAGVDTGTLNSWSLDITTCSCAAVACELTCPADIIVTGDPSLGGAFVNYPAPTTVGSCGIITCAPASGSFFSAGTTTVTCTSAAGPECAFSVTVFDICLQDDSNASTVIQINSFTGDYQFCCHGTVYTGKGTITRKGNTYALQHYAADRRVVAKLDNARKSGSASLQFPPGKTICTIADRNTTNNSCACP
jgi:subtilisin-like proprotein convertase family protein